MYSECLRLEVAALGVRVLILVTGTVHTKVFDNQPTINIPEKSFFAPIASFLQNLPVETAAMNRMPADQYAQQVVQSIESGASGKVYLGGLSSVFKNVAWWIPNWAWVSSEASITVRCGCDADFVLGSNEYVPQSGTRQAHSGCG